MIVESFMTFLHKIMFFSSYIKNCSSFPKPLTAEEEKEYLEKFKNGDEKAKEILIHYNLRLVAHIVKKYNQADEADDLISVGSLGLIKAINTYQLNHGTQFSTYAARCIENEILMLIRTNKKHKNNVSIEDVLGTDDEENEIKLGDLNFDEENDVEKIVEHKMLSQNLDAILKKNLSKREYQIICMRYGLCGLPVLTQREVAKRLDISRSYISRLETKSLNILKRAINRKEFGY